MIKLDYNLKTPEERLALVNKILEENAKPTKQYLEILADYLAFCMEKEEKKEKKILTENRLTTVNKRETSYEGLVSQFENGEDGVYNITTENNKNTIFQPKISITKHDLETIPELRQTSDAIAFWAEVAKNATGKSIFLAKKALIESRKDQYVIKNALRPPVQSNKLIRSQHWIPLEDHTHLNEKGEVVPEGISLANPQVCSAILCNYSGLRQKCQGIFYTDT